jgi:hypothetical protein
MNSQELNEGNWVLHGKERAVVKNLDKNVRAIKIIQLKGDPNYYPESEIEPLPLDEDLLDELGFNFDEKLYSKDGLYLDTPINGSCSIIENPIKIPIQKVDSAHQLQNLLADILSA